MRKVGVCPLYYHVTEAKNLSGILRDGLIPSIGPRSQMIGETVPAVYLFPDLDSVVAAVENWLGEVFDEDVSLIFLELQLPSDIEKALFCDSAEYERISRLPIPPNCIVRVIDEDDIEEEAK